MPSGSRAMYDYRQRNRNVSLTPRRDVPFVRIADMPEDNLLHVHRVPGPHRGRQQHAQCQQNNSQYVTQSFHHYFSFSVSCPLQK